MNVKEFFDETTWTLTYVVWDPSSLDALVIDPVLNYNQASSTYRTHSVDEASEFIRSKDLKLHLILETHAHADHLTGAQEFKRRFPSAKIGIGEPITKVQKIFKDLFNLDTNFKTDASQFDFLTKEGEVVNAGTIQVKTMSTPGHTPACSSYLIADMVFTGDALFMPDFGVARCDFPGGDARALFQSVKNKLYKLPAETRVFTGHDYQPGGRKLKFMSTIAEERALNIHINDQTQIESFVEFRTKRDQGLEAPKLLLPSIQVNIRAGKFPEPESNGMSYLKIPLRPGKGE